MVKFTNLCLALVGMFYIVQGQISTISTKFMNGKLTFSWTNISKAEYDIMICTDFCQSKRQRIRDDQYTVEDVMRYKSVTISVWDFKTQRDYNKTYQVNKIESKEGESKNISWTIETFPATGNYMIFHSTRNGSYSKIININDGTAVITGGYVYHSKPVTSKDILFEIRNIALADAGHYMGGSTESFALSGGKDAVLVVYGKPVKPVIKGGDSIKVNTQASLKCESRSTSAPEYYKKPFTYIWYVNNTEKPSINTERYNFHVTKDLKYTRYSCQMKENLTSERSEEIQLDPLYGPESVLITPTPTQNTLTIKDGELLRPYNCSADCNPPCTLQWKYKKSPGTFVDAPSFGNSSITLLELKAARTRMTHIQCVANNSEGRKEYLIALNILYLSNPKIFLNGDKQHWSDIREGDPLNISCSVEGNPTPTINLSKASQSPILRQERTHWLNYTIAKAKCSDTGTYRCTGNTTQLGIKHKDFTVNVICEPRLDTSVSFKTNYGSMSGLNVKVDVAVPVLANPFPSTYLRNISWRGPGTPIKTNIVSKRDNTTYKHWINSIIPIPGQASFGNYSLMYNGKVIVNIAINAEDKPQPPSNFSWYSYAGGYINLTWISNFNGGPEQFFILSRKEGFNWTLVKNITDPGERNMGSYGLGSLAPGQEHWYQIESCNRINCSLSPAEVKVIIQDQSVSNSLFSNTLIVIGASVMVFVLVVVLTLVITMCFRKKKSVPQKGNSDEKASGPTAEDNTQPDVVVYAAVDKSLLMKNKQQADVVKSDVIKDQNDDNETMYSEVIKHPKKHDQTNAKKEKKNKNGEMKELPGKEEEAGASNMNEETRTVNQDGLVYIDVEFTKKPQSSDTMGRPVIHGEEERTEYTFVDFSQKAPPIQEPQDAVK